MDPSYSKSKNSAFRIPNFAFRIPNSAFTMSKLFIPLLSLTLLLACQTTQKAQSPPPPVPTTTKTTSELVTWDKKLVDLGSVKKG